MKKKYQVFISSTYRDLQEERAVVIQCLLEMGCIPVGMEQFPASNMSQMEYIKMMMDDCDYYVLILAGKYGTLDADGIGFTEKEYDYALEKKIPVMSFVIKDREALPDIKKEDTEEKRNKLDDFQRKVCREKLVKFYTNKDELRGNVAVSLNSCIKTFPALGWERGNSIEEQEDIESRFEKYMEKHCVLKNGMEIILDGGNANS